MKTQIVDRDNCLNAASTAFADRRLRFALSRFDSKIVSAVLTVEDNNGPRGGIDKKCQLLIKMHRGQDVVISDMDHDLKCCLSRVADRAGRTVARRLCRVKDSYRRRGSIGSNIVTDLYDGATG